MVYKQSFGIEYILYKIIYTVHTYTCVNTYIIKITVIYSGWRTLLLPVYTDDHKANIVGKL